ncbi:MAG: SAM-dependent chlorinase/fluorinase [Bacteroidota bacterium]
MAAVLTLTTDFGLRDAYVAAMKGQILRVHPTALLVDLTHEVPPQDVMTAAFLLRQTWSFYPEGTTHLVVVDPGVGTARRPLAMSYQGHTFVGPDNGLFALLLDGATPDALVVLDRPAYWGTPAPHPTFHGRDLFAPVAAHLAAGRTLTDVGTPADTLVPMRWALPIADQQGVRGWVMHVDHFGNCITNIHREVVEVRRGPRRLKGYAGSTILDGVHPTYAAVAEGDPLLVYGSSNHLEVAVNAGNASDLLGIRAGAPVNIVFLDEA